MVCESPALITNPFQKSLPKRRLRGKVPVAKSIFQLTLRLQTVSDLLDKQDSVFIRKFPTKYPSSRFGPENWFGLFSGVFLISFTSREGVPTKSWIYNDDVHSHEINQSIQKKHLAAHVDRAIGLQHPLVWEMVEWDPYNPVDS